MSGLSTNFDARVARAAFMDWFGITDSLAYVLWLLWNYAGSLTAVQLAVLSGSTEDAMAMRITRLRACMDCEAIDSGPGQGYRLTDVGQKECALAMQESRASLLRALALQEARAALKAVA